MSRQAKHGTRTTYVRGCRCDLCKEANRLYGQDLKDRKRQNKLVLVPLRSPTSGPEPSPGSPPDDGPGPVENAVVKEIGLLTEKVRTTYPGLIMSTVAMARDLDNPALATTHPSSQRQLMVALDKLHSASVGRKGKLGVVAEMSNRTGMPANASTAAAES